MPYIQHVARSYTALTLLEIMYKRNMYSQGKYVVNKKRLSGKERFLSQNFSACRKQSEEMMQLVLFIG